MAKAILNIGYTEYVLDIEIAIKLAAVLTDAEIYKRVYRSDANGGPTTHVYTNPRNENATITIMSDAHINMSRLAGAPKE